MSSIVGAVSNGVYTKTNASTEATASSGKASTSISKAASSTANTYNSDMFLQLLVAEMQYQDPLEPTSKTEYVSELASFSQIEAVQAVQDQMKTLEANSLVGKYVIVLQDNEYVSGKVDYVYNDGGELYLAIGDKKYSIDNLDSVVDAEYYNGVLDAESFADAVAKLPSVSAITLSDEKAVVAAREAYDKMSDYTKGLVASSSLSTLEALETRIAALKKAQEAADE